MKGIKESKNISFSMVKIDNDIKEISISESSLIIKLCDAIEAKDSKLFIELFSSRHLVADLIKLNEAAIKFFDEGGTPRKMELLFFLKRKQNFPDFTINLLEKLKQCFQEENINSTLKFAIELATMKLFKDFFCLKNSVLIHHHYKTHVKINQGAKGNSAIKILYFECKLAESERDFLYEWVDELLGKIQDLNSHFLGLICRDNALLEHVLFILPTDSPVRGQIERSIEKKPTPSYMIDSESSRIDPESKQWTNDSMKIETRLENTEREWVIIKDEDELQKEFPGIELYQMILQYSLFWKESVTDDKKRKRRIESLVERVSEKELNSLYGIKNTSLLMQACYRGFKAMVDTLSLRKEIKINLKDKTGATALEFALGGKSIINKKHGSRFDGIYDGIIQRLRELDAKQNLQIQASLTNNFEEFKEHLFSSPDFIDIFPGFGKDPQTFIEYFKRANNEDPFHPFWSERPLLDIFIRIALNLNNQEFNQVDFKIDRPVISFTQIFTEGHLIHLDGMEYATEASIKISPWLLACYSLLTADNVNQSLIKAMSKPNYGLAIICILKGADIYIKDSKDRTLLSMIPRAEFFIDDGLLQIFLGFLIMLGYYSFQYTFLYRFCSWSEETLPGKIYIDKEEDFLKCKLINLEDSIVQLKIPIAQFNLDTELVTITPQILEILAKGSHITPILRIDNRTLDLSKNLVDKKNFILFTIELLIDNWIVEEEDCFLPFFVVISKKQVKKFSELKSRIEKKTGSCRTHSREDPSTYL